MARVIIPQNVDEFINLLDLIIEKEQSLAPKGTLQPDELKQLRLLRDEAQDANTKQAALRKQAEELVTMRDNALGVRGTAKVSQPDTAMYFVTELRDLLLAKNKTNPKVLGEWGFEVDNSPQKKKTKE